MGYYFEYKTNFKIPQLSWLSIIDPKMKLTVIKGSAVEYHTNWMVEGVWDDDFEKGNFHQSENFFGSRIRVEDDKVFFVSSSSITDRLFLANDRDRIYVSNSLILILGATGADLDPTHHYQNEGLPLINGINNYNRNFKVIHPRISYLKQIFFENIIITKGEISYKERTRPNDIQNYEDYYSYLETVLFNLKKNWSCSKRKNKVSAVTTISQGYDSTAVSALASKVGVRECYTGQYLNRLFIFNFFQNRVKDNGDPAAKNLGLNINYLDRKRSSISEDEIYFLAVVCPKFSDYSCFELTFHSLTAEVGKKGEIVVVFNGSGGDIIWSTEPKFLSNNLVRKDISGLPLTEIRLKTGFFTVAIPYILVRQLLDIAKISISDEMKPWRFHNEYDRPIPRRIAEESGVERKNFGIKKTFVADRYYLPVNKELRKQFVSYLWKCRSIHPTVTYLYSFLYQLLIGFRIQLRKHGFSYRPELVLMKITKIDLTFLMSQWAIGVLAKKMKTILYY